jgi:hypothetical protein
MKKALHNPLIETFENCHFEERSDEKSYVF